MYFPKKSKYKKQQKNILFNKVLGSGSTSLSFGSIGLKSLSFKRLSSKHLEIIRKVVGKQVKKTGKVIFSGFPNTPVTRKPLETRMGKGKGVLSNWVLNVKPGFIIFEIVTDNLVTAIRVLNLLRKKLNLKTKIIFN